MPHRITPQGSRMDPLVLHEMMDPAALGDAGKVYSKDVAGNTELFYEDSSGNKVQITSGGAVPGLGGTVADIYQDSILKKAAAQELNFVGATVTASGTAARIATPNYYDATFIVGAGDGCTHATASGAVAAGAAMSSYKIAFKAEDHALAAKLAIVTTGKRIAVVATGAKLTLAAGVDDNAVEVTGTGSLEWDGGIIDQGKAGQATGNGLHINVGAARIRTHNLIVQNAKVQGIYYTDGAGGADIEFNTTEANSCDGDGWYAFNLLGATLNKCRAAGNTGYGFTEHTSAGTVTYNDCTGTSNLIGLYSPSLARTVVNGGQYSANVADGVQIETQGSVQNARVFSNGTNGIIAQNTDQFSISNNEVYLNAHSGILVNGASLNAAVDDNQIYENGRHGIACNNPGGGPVTGLSIGNNALHNNGTSAANTYSGIYLDDAVKCIVDGNVITGSNHKYGIEETATSATNKYTDNQIFDAATDEYLILAADSKVEDPCDVRGEFNWDITSGTAVKTITGLGTGSCPTSFEFYAADRADSRVFSRGSDDGTYADCMTNDENGGSDSSSGVSIWVQNAAGSGYTGLISILGAAGGNPQDQFSISMTQVSGGRDIKVRYKAWR